MIISNEDDAGTTEDSITQVSTRNTADSDPTENHSINAKRELVKEDLSIPDIDDIRKILGRQFLQETLVTAMQQKTTLKTERAVYFCR